MNDEKMTEAMARLEFAGRDVEFSFPAHRPRIAHITIENGDLVARNYLTSHDAVQRVWLTLTANEKRLAIAHLTGLGGILESGGSGRFLLDMSASEWCEAILKAVGKWED